MLLILLKTSIGVLIFAVGMTATTDDIMYLWRRPVLLLKSIAAMYVVMPIIAVLMACSLNLPPKTELALVILAICAGAPLLPKKLIKLGGDPSYIFSLIVTTSLLAVITVPASLWFLTGIIPFEAAAVTSAQVARVILKSFMLPLGLGMLLRLFSPARMEQVGTFLIKVASMVMALCAIVALAAGFHLFFNVGLPSLLSFALFASVAILTGHLLGGPDPASRTSLAIACLSRHIGLALLIAANARGQQALSLVVAYLFASGVVSMFYIIWMKRRKRIE